ncbi:MAG TPA: hypothetical protein VJN93_12645 [Candidatus Acidoferrum sp.]|nr:hypothetical protein [Candidatus Acidoferrum sp.]
MMTRTSQTNWHRILSAMLLILAAGAFGWAQENKALTNKDIMDMVKQGLSDSMIVKVIQASDTNFDTSPDAMTQMQSAGASLKVMDAMLKAAAPKKKTAATPTQPAAPTAAPRASADDPHAGKYLLREGTPVLLKFATDESSRYATEGDKVALTLSSDLRSGDVVLVKEGAKATAVVTHVKKSGFLPGSNGELSIQVKELANGSERIRLRGSPQRDGVLGPVGYLKHGNIEVDEGTSLTAYVDEDTWLAPVQ